MQKNGSTVAEGTIIRRPKYARTLETIRDDPDDFYTGKLAETIVSDIRARGGDVTLEDMKNYEVKRPETLSMKIGDLVLHTLPRPSGGPVLIHILSICKGG